MISETDRKIVEELKKRDIVRKLDFGHIHDGVLFVCGDCDHIGDIMDWHKACYRFAHKNRDPKFQELKLNGGPLNLSYPPLEDPDHSQIVQRFLLDQINDGLTLNKLSRIKLFGHWPCRQAELWGLDLARALRQFTEAWEIVMQWFPKARVVCRYHFDFGDAPMETRHFRPCEWRKQSADVLRAVHG